MHKWFTIPSWHFCAITQLVKALWLAGLNQDQRHILDICFQFLIISIVLDNFWKASIYSDYCNSRFFGWTGYAGVCPSAWKSKTLSFYAHRTALLVLNIQVGSIFSFFAFLRGIGFACMLGWVNVVSTLRWLRDFRACSRMLKAQGKTGHYIFETGLKSYVLTKLFCVTKWECLCLVCLTCLNMFI